MLRFSPPVWEDLQVIRRFLFKRMYHHYTIKRIWNKVDRIVTDLFTAFTDNYELMPDNWQRRVVEAGGDKDSKALARIVCDYIAGMTDRYAIREHERLFDLYWDLR